MGPKLGSALQKAVKRKDPPASSGSKPLNTANNRAAPNPKRAKFLDARQIAAQGPDDGLKDGELDLQAFMAARAFEINALEDSMRNTKAASSSRTFQRFPRSMRRRTASHNPKRVPKRLRSKAMREFKDDNTPLVVARRRRPTTTRGRMRAETAKKLGILAEKKKKRKARAEKEKAKDKGDAMDIDGGAPVSDKVTVTTRAPRPKIRRNTLNTPDPVKSKFRRRQISKTWLPTHVWHAKRARMTDPKNPLWRFAVPLTPNEKTYRPTHRAQGESGAVVWDMSYISTIGVCGNSAGIERVLKKLGITNESCWDDRGRKWRAGTRLWEGMLSRQASGSRPQRDIVPATVLWDPEQTALEGDGSAKGKTPRRQVFIRVHPSAFLELFNELLRLTKMENPRLYIEDLRFQIGAIDLTGPASTEALLGILIPYLQDGEAKEKHAELFTSLNGLTNPAALPANAVLGFSIQDPRLRYPPRTVQQPKSQNDDDFLNMLATWPAENGVAPNQLWSRDARYAASKLPSKRSIDRRKSLKTPGAYLKPTEADPPIPVTLLAQRTGSGAQSQGTWTLLAPWKCILPIWYSLVHYPLHSGGNPRLGGLNEARQVAFERGLPWFPADFIGTNAGAEWEMGEREKRKAHWDRRPKGKRTTWESIELGAGRRGEVGNGLHCDFEHLFSQIGGAGPTAELMDVDNPTAEQGSKGSQQKHKEGLETITQLSKTQFSRLLKKSNSTKPAPPRSVLQVRVSFLTKGVATTCARIYRLPSKPPTQSQAEGVIVPATDPPEPTQKPTDGLPTNLRDQWLSLISNAKQTAKPTASLPLPPRIPPDADLNTRKRLLAQSLVSTPLPYPLPAPNETDISGHPLVPDAEDLIGFVTAGAFCLSEGRGVAVASISAEKVLDDLRGPDAKEGRICVVRNAGENVGRLARWEII
ncbi:related to ribonuclease P chain POP1 [Cephalotrichum gorgonifer]|uniref:Related to ribonuclease P chain POP1 n=1 Tax=Cephalotrichum gorgonifer TaxID=2041049 RepID=A0AAE8MU21_9PEZI|nr:related to ribonuclease P chain POP1 [Cephalotrichum gorgonifer]